MRLHLGDDVREVTHPIGSVVYLRMRDEPMRGLVTGYHVWPDQLSYAVTWGNGNETTHFAIELSAEFEPHFAAAGGPPAGEGE